MFEGVLGESEVFKKVIESIKELVKEVNIEVSSKGMEINSMDNSKVALICLKLYSSCFEKFRCKKKERIGVNVEVLYRMFRCVNNEDRMTIRMEEKSTKIYFRFENDKLNKVSEFNVNLQTIEDNDFGVPNDKYSAILKMPSNEFGRITRELGFISEYVNIQVKDEYVKFSFEGEMGDGVVTLHETMKEHQNEQISIKVDQPVEQCFVTRYLNLFNKAGMLSEHVIISMHHDNPIVVEYKMGQKGQLVYYLAPKIEEQSQESD